MAEKLKVLIIDDEPLILSSLSCILSDEYEVITAEEGISELSMFFEHQPSVLLVDINMPFISGIEVLARIRDIDNQIPVVMMTGNGDTDPLWVMRCKELGISGYLTKPVFPDTLLSRIECGISKQFIPCEL